MSSDHCVKFHRLEQESKHKSHGYQRASMYQEIIHYNSEAQHGMAERRSGFEPLPLWYFVCYAPAHWRCSVWTRFRAPGGCPGASISVVCALGGFLLRPRWVPCWIVCAWCLHGTGCGVMHVWCLGKMHVSHPGWGVIFGGSCCVVSLRW